MGLEVEETIGHCKRCNKEDYLGEGLCQRCWDRQIGKNRYYVPVPIYNIDGTRVKEQQSYIARVKCAGCGIEIDAPTFVGRRPSKQKRCRDCNVKRWQEYTKRKQDRIEKETKPVNIFASKGTRRAK